MSASVVTLDDASQNRFKHVSFAEQLKRLDHRPTLRVGEAAVLNDLPEDGGTFFAEGLEKWQELNCSHQFQEFHRSVYRKSQSLNLLVLHRDEITASLLQAVATAGELSAEPLLDLLVQLARDLQGDFYAQFPAALASLAAVVTPTSKGPVPVPVLSAAFTALTYLFKTLRSHLVKDFEQFWGYFHKTLLSSKKDYIQQFAAESCSYIVRKLRPDAFAAFTNLALDALESGQQHMTDAVGALLFETIRHVQMQLHSKTRRILTTCLALLARQPDQGDDACCFSVLKCMLEKAVDYTRQEYAAVLWSGLFSRIQHVLDQLEALRGKRTKAARVGRENHAVQLTRLYKLVAVVVSWRKASRVPEASSETMQAAIPILEASIELCSTLAEEAKAAVLGAVCLIASKRTQLIASSKIVLSIMTSDAFQPMLLLPHLAVLFPIAEFQRGYHADLLQLLLKGLLPTAAAAEQTTGPVSDDEARQEEGGEAQQSRDCALAYLVIWLREVGSLAPATRKRLSGPLTALTKRYRGQLASEEGLARTWAAIHCVRVAKCKEAAKYVQSLIPELADELVSRPPLPQAEQGAAVASASVCLLAEAVSAAAGILSATEAGKLLKGVEQAVLTAPAHGQLLSAYALLLDVLPETKRSRALAWGDVYEALRPNLGCADQRLRRSTLRVLTLYPAEPFARNGAADETEAGDELGLCDVFQVCLAIAEHPPSFESHRPRKAGVERLLKRRYLTRLPTVIQDCVPRFLVGEFHVPLALVWDDAKRALAEYSKCDAEAFWSIYFAEVQAACLNVDALDVNDALQADHYRLDTTRTTNKSQRIAARDNPINQVKPVDRATLPGLLAQQQSPSAQDSASPELTPVDHLKFHNLVWGAMLAFPALAEKHNRDLVPIILGFVDEYEDAYEGAGKTQDLTAIQEGDGADGDADETPAGPDWGAARRLRGQRRKLATRRMCDYLRLLGTWKNPKSAWNSTDLRGMYLSLLQRSDDEIQELAFRALATFKDTYLKPYSENLLRIIDERTNSIRAELVAFPWFPEAGDLIKAEHREGLFPILVTILLAKMQKRKGKGHGQNTPKARRGVILKYFMACTDAELRQVVETMLRPFSALGDSMDLPLQQMIPLKTQLGLLKLLGDAIRQMGYRIEPQIAVFLPVVLRLCKLASVVLDQRAGIQKGHVSILRSIRQQAIQRLIDTFTSFPNGDYCAHKAAIEEHVVWPQLESLVDESLQQPSPLLAFIKVCCAEPRFHQFLELSARKKAGTGRRSTGARAASSVLPYVFPLLSKRGASGSVIQAVLSLVDSLIPEGQESVPLLEPHINVLLDHLSKLLLSQGTKALESDSGPLQLSILSRLSRFDLSRDNAIALTDMLVPHLSRRRRMTPSTVSHVLRTIRSFVKYGATQKHYETLCGFMATLHDPHARLELCRLLETLGETKECAFLAEPAKLLLSMNAMSTGMGIEAEPDYETRLQAMFDFNDDKVAAFAPQQMLPVVHCYLAFLIEEDVSLRNNASQGLRTLIGRAAAACGPACDTAFEGAADDAKGLRDLINLVAVPFIRKGLRSDSEAAREELFRMLGDVVRAFPESPRFKELARLTDSEDDDKDLFANLLHIQKHRRIRAVQSIASAAQEGELSQAPAVQYLIPLITPWIYDVKTMNHNVVEAVVTCVGAMCTCLSWGHYSTLLNQHISLIPKKRDAQKPLLRMVVSLINNFPFDVQHCVVEQRTQPYNATASKPARQAPPARAAEVDEEAEGEGAEGVGDDGGDGDGGDGMDGVVETNTTAAASPQYILNAVTSKILPGLYRFLSQKDEKGVTVRSPVAHAIVALLLKLPAALLPEQLPPLLAKLVAPLRHRHVSFRDETRTVLGKIAMSLGPHYFPFIIRGLKNGLRRGYQLHVLGYTVHSILQAMAPACDCGVLDDCIEDLVGIFIDDIFGVIGEEKEVAAIASKVKEARKTMSYDSFLLVAKLVHPSRFQALLQPLRDVLVSSDTLKDAERLRTILRNVALGLNANDTVGVGDVLRLCHAMVGENLALSQGGQVAKKPKSRRTRNAFLLEEEVPRQLKPRATLNTNAHLLIEFSFQLMVSLFKRSRIDRASEEHAGMLRPFLPMLRGCLKSKHDHIVTMALRLLAHLIGTGSEHMAIDAELPPIATRVLKLLKRGTASEAASEAHQACCQLMAVLLREQRGFTIGDGPLRVLLSIIHAELQEGKQQAAVFALLKAIVSRQFVVPELYDVMDFIATAMIQSSSLTVRENCQKVFLSFLLDYPLGKKRLEKHINFLLANIEYEYESGRESALSMLESVIMRFPDEVVNEHGKLIFVPLVALLVNAEGVKAREVACRVIRLLATRLTGKHRTVVQDLALKWLTEDCAWRRSAIQICGLFVETYGEEYRDLAQVAGVLRRLAVRHRDQGEGQDAVFHDREHWVELYMSLSALEKVFTASPELCKGWLQRDESDNEELWASITGHLLYSHAWVRLAACRVLGFAMSLLDAETLHASGTCLSDPLPLAYALCSEMQVETLADKLAEQIVRNLYFLGHALYAQRAADEEAGKALVKIFKKLGYFARREAARTPEQRHIRECSFKWFAAMATLGKGSDVLIFVLPFVMDPLYRTYESKASDEGIKELGTQVQEVLKDAVGGPAFYKAFNRARDNLANIRDDRKRKRAVEAVTDPEKRARMRASKLERKKASRKRKVDAFKSHSRGRKSLRTDT